MGPRVAALVLALATHALACPNYCSNNGYCSDKLSWKCVCDDGFTGPDCSERLCPAGKAWADYATDNETAHRNDVECSGFGICDRMTGLCQCRLGFEGTACERLACPKSENIDGTKHECGAHGRCISMSEAAEQIDFYALWREDSYAGWDKDMVFGCVCDPGYEGFDCSNRVCPLGDDPVTDGLDEIQLIDCACGDGWVDPTDRSVWGSCNGSLSLKFRGQVTRPIDHDANALLVQRRLLELSTIQDVTVSFSLGPGSSLCRPTSLGGQTALVTFRRPYGDVETLDFVDASKALDVAVFKGGAASQLHPKNVSRTGTKENVECSDRGTCLRDSGTCSCYKGFSSSDGRGGMGTLGDCGYYNGTLSRCPIVVPIWGNENLECSGVAYNCSGAPHFKCNCSAGYSGAACEFKDCPLARSWFDEALDGHGHKNRSTCSGRGLCDQETGLCACDATNSLFEGDACQRFTCPTNDSQTCGPYGECQTMAKRARRSRNEKGELMKTVYTKEWDAQKIRTCGCTEMQGIYGYNTSDEMYRGPFAYAYTDGSAYDCSQGFCPTGDNPYTYGVNEVQLVNCTAKKGSFRLVFRNQASDQIKASYTIAQVVASLQASASIGRVAVTFSNTSKNAQVCHPQGNVMSVEFLTEFGELPLLRQNTDAALDGSINVTRSVNCTKENVECSARGVCNRGIGVCDCLEGHTSSSGAASSRESKTNGERGKYGQRGDCGFRFTDTEAYMYDSYAWSIGSAGMG